MDAFAFVEERQPIGIALVARYAVVSDERICRNKDLSCVGWVCQAFGVARHGGIEDDLTCCGAVTAEGVAIEDRTVFENEFNLFQFGHVLLSWV